MLARSWPERAQTATCDIAVLRDGPTVSLSLDPQTRDGKARELLILDLEGHMLAVRGEHMGKKPVSTVDTTAQNYKGRLTATLIMI